MLFLIQCYEIYDFKISFIDIKSDNFKKNINIRIVFKKYCNATKNKINITLIYILTNGSIDIKVTSLSIL